MTETDPSEDSRKYTVVSRRQKLIPVPFPPGWVNVSRWNDEHESKAHELVGADLQMPGGRPYGYLWYRHHATGKDIRIGVRWSTEMEAIDSHYLHAQKAVPGQDRDFVEAELAEADARARVAALMSLNSFIGAQVLATHMEDAILDAAGLGLKRIGGEFLGLPAEAESVANGEAEDAPAPAVLPDPGDGEAVITGLRLGEGAIAVPTWPGVDLPGWERAGWDLTFKNGHPFGSLGYEHTATGDRLRVGVGWHEEQFELMFVPLHPTEARPADLTEGVENAVRDARARVGYLVAIHTVIGEMVTGPDSARQILAASGFDGDIDYIEEPRDGD